MKFKTNAVFLVAFSVFEEVVINEIIPMIDAKFRTITNREDLAIAGLSMGANQTMRIIINYY